MKYSNKFRDKFQGLTSVKKIEFIDTLSQQELETLYLFPEFFLFDKQLVEGDDWRYYILLCGRAFGKSYAGSGWLYRKILNGAKTLACCAPTYADLLGVMIPAIMQWSPPNKKPIYNKVDHTLKYHNGAIVWCYSADTEVRGPNIEYLWCDEIAKWADSIPEKVKERFEIMDYAVRAGKTPQTVITTTPKPFPIIREWKEKAQTTSLYKIATGTMFDNPFLPESYKNAMLEQYGGTRLGRQELYGELLLDVEGALWSGDMIEKDRISALKFKDTIKLERVVVGVDPAVTDGTESDSTGIVVAGYAKGHAYILADYTVKTSPDKWAIQVVKAYETFNASMVIAEINQGGDLVTQVIRTVSKNLPIKTIHAKKSKLVRAEPVAALYEQHKVHHVGVFKALEDEMTSYNGNPKLKSPDHLDAMCYAVSELMLQNVYTNRNFDNIGVFG
jgi:predicted phage terminase large subunit-like protein